MRKLLPMLFCGVAAVSFSAFAQTSAQSDSPTHPNAQGRSVDTGGARPDSSKAQGTVPQHGAVNDTSGSASVGSAGRVGATQQGRSIDTGGGRPDSSKAQGAAPVTSRPGSATSGSSGEATTHRDASAGSSAASRDEEARRKTRQGETSGIGGGTTTTGSGATTTTPGSVGGPNSGAGR